jgi:riboflavin biosynthesis pyrimidine reductase
MVFCSVDAFDRHGPLAFRGVNVIPLGRTAIRRVSLPMVMQRLAPNATHVLVEPGPTLARSFLREGELPDRIWVIRSAKRIDQPSAPAGVGVPSDFVKTGEIDLAGDRLIEYLNPASPVFFAAAPSADFVLAGEAT